MNIPTAAITTDLEGRAPVSPSLSVLPSPLLEGRAPASPSLPQSKFEIRNSKISAALTFSVPETDADLAQFHSLPRKVRDDVDQTLLALENLHGARKLNPACKLLAPSLPLHRPLSWHRLRSKHYAYLRSQGDWRVLVDWTRVKKSARPGLGALSGADEALCPDFINFLKGLMGSNQRKSEPAIRKLYQLWRGGESIPGYGAWPQWFQREHPHTPLPRKCPPDLPRGWSKSNLRRYIPDDAELALSRRGISEARRHLPSILTTRQGLRPLEFVMFDDVRTDFRILVPGYASPVELHLLVALDVATGVILRYGMRPAVPRADGMADKLKLRDMKALVAGVLQQYGLPRHWTMTLIVENATAAIRDSFEAALKEASLIRVNPCSSVVKDSVPVSAIEVHRTEMICGSAIWAGYKDRATGNPGGKAALESTFNLFHNEAAFLPGQTGRRYDAGPSELHGRTTDAVALHRSARHLAPHERAALRLPFLRYADARVVVTDLWNRITARTDHRMEGFEVVGEFRLGEHAQWRPESDLVNDPALASVLSAISSGHQQPIQWRNPARKESPMERWSRLCELAYAEFCSSSVPSVKSVESLFRRLHPSVITRLLEEQKLRPIENFEITFDHDKEAHHYRVADAVSVTCADALKNGAQVLCYYDSSDLSWIHLTDAQGGYLGSIPETLGLDRRNKAALQAAYKAKRAQLHQLQKTVSERLPARLDDQLADAEHNVNVLAAALENSEALETPTGSPISAQGCEERATLGNSTPSDLNPEGVDSYAHEIGKSKFAAAVAQRQAHARQLAPVATNDCTDELLSREHPAATSDDWQQ